MIVEHRGIYRAISRRRSLGQMDIAAEHDRLGAPATVRLDRNGDPATGFLELDQVSESGGEKHPCPMPGIKGSDGT